MTRKSTMMMLSTGGGTSSPSLTAANDTSTACYNSMIRGNVGATVAFGGPGGQGC
jgi:hypothetical protein